ncbi:MAG: 30S ribosomal protein S21 [Ginsengibacter sp.]
MSYIEIKITGDEKRDRAAFDVGLSEFKKRMKRSGIMEDYRRKEHYLSPSAARKFKRNEAIKRRKRDERKLARPQHNEF